MSARARRRSAAISLTIAVTTGAALLLTACDPATTSAAGSASPAAAGSAAPSATAVPSAPQSPVAGSSAAPTAAPTTAGGSPTPARSTAPTQAPAAPSKTPTTAPAPLNGTAHNGLTISNGTQYVVMNGTTVDFGTSVRDLAWSPDGGKAAFIDGAGDLAIANPNGSGRVTVARHPAGETWSHPAWQVAAASQYGYYPAKDNLFFAAAKGGVSRLEKVPATAVDGTPNEFSLGNREDTQPNPETGNLWPAGGGSFGTSVYANSGTGEVFIRDESVRQQGGPVTRGSEPALSPDGEEVVFVRSVDGHDHLFEVTNVESSDVTAAKDLTPHATTDYTEPAWASDGKTIAARTPNGIVTLPVNGSAAPTLVSGYSGLPAYRHS